MSILNGLYIDWEDYLVFLESKEYGERIIDIWKQIINIVPNISEPQAGYFEEYKCFEIVWNNKKHHLEIDIFDDGTIEWFYLDRENKHSTNSGDSLITIPKYLLTLFSKDENAKES